MESAVSHSECTAPHRGTVNVSAWNPSTVTAVGSHLSHLGLESQISLIINRTSILIT